MASPGRPFARRHLLLALASAWPAAAVAHPVDELVQASYLTLVPDGVRLELDLTPGIEVAYYLLPTIDRDRDRQVSDAEARAFATTILKQLPLAIDGKATPWRLTQVELPSFRGIRLGATMKIIASAPRPERPGEQQLRFANRYPGINSRCYANIFLRPRDGWRVTGQQHSNDGRSMIVSYAANPP